MNSSIAHVFAINANRTTLTPRLVKSELLPNDPKLIERILAVRNQTEAGARVWGEKIFEWGILSLDFSR